MNFRIVLIGTKLSKCLIEDNGIMFCINKNTGNQHCLTEIYLTETVKTACWGQAF